MAYTPVELTKGGKTTVASNLQEETRLRWDGWLPTGQALTPHRSVAELLGPDAEKALRAAYGTATFTGSDSSPADRPKRLPPGLSGLALHRRALLGPSASGWDSSNVGIGFDVVLNPATGRYTMLYTGYDGATTTQIGLAEADSIDGPWTKHGGNPIIGANPTAGQPDSGGVSFPQVLWHDGLWHIYYGGFPNPGYEQGNPKVCLITTPDLKAGPYTRRGAVLTASQFPYAGASGQVWRPNAVKLGGKFYIFTNAGPAVGQEKMHYAVADSPLGPFTAGNGGNPIMDPTAIGNPANTINSDPEVVRFGNLMVMFFWAQSSGLWYATSDLATEFPNTWHVNPTMIPGTGGYVRPVWVDSPAGPRLLAHTNNQRIDSFIPQAALRGVATARRPMTPGRSYRPGGLVDMSDATAGDGYLTCVPFPIDQQITLYSLSVRVTSPNIGNVRLGLYADNGGGLPGALVVEGVTSADNSTTGVKTFTLGTPLVLPPGMYWTACVAQGGSPGVRCVALISSDLSSSTVVDQLFYGVSGLYTPFGGVSGALPNPAPALDTATEPIPLVVMTL